MCMFPHHMSNPSVSSHANSASTENHLLEGDSPQPFPHHDRHDRVLSNHPTFPLYKKKSVMICAGLEDSPSFGQKLGVSGFLGFKRATILQDSEQRRHRRLLFATSLPLATTGLD